MSGNQNAFLMYNFLKHLDKQNPNEETYANQLLKITWKLYFNLNEEDQQRVVTELETELFENE